MGAEKQITKHSFEGGINTTSADEIIPNNQARSLYNCNILSQGEGQVGIVTKPKGNLNIQFTLPDGENKVIGTAVNEENNNFYFFIWNSEGYHRIQQYNSLTKTISLALENLTDTGNVDIMGLDPDYLILHAEVVRGNLLYWVDGLNNARKTNISKLFDNSATGYGTTILQEFIDAYKQTSSFAPTANYFSDTDKPFNRLYGRLTKYAYRYIYDDGEKSTYSDFSGVALPDNEPFTGINSIPTNNNGINVTINTGGRLVKRIEVVMQSTSAEPNDESILSWVLIATLDKKKLNLGDYSDYTYKFYNDQNYPAVDQTEVIQAYSYMPLCPKCMAVAKRALTYANGYQGFGVVDVDASITISYEELFLDPGTENEFNEPEFIHEYGTGGNDRDVIGGLPETITSYNNVTSKVILIRGNVHKLTIGNDVKKGNKFTLTHNNGVENYQWKFEAGITDSAQTVASFFRQKLIETNRILRKMPETGDNNIYDNTIDGEGNVSFQYIFFNKSEQGYMNGSTFVQPVEFSTLKDTGQSIRNIKMGSTFKLGLIYEDFDGRKSLTYTIDALVVGVQPVNTSGLKKTKVLLQVNHRPPVWAKYYQVVRTNDLKYSDFIQGLIQKVVEIETTDQDNSEYLDLVVGSFATYKKIHPNSTLTFQFEKGDRISLIKKTDDDTYYPFFETEVIDYESSRTDRISSNLVTHGTTTVDVETASDDNIGKFILVDGSEREIIATTSTTYELNAPLGDTTEKTYLYYDLEDRRATLRIRKPSDITIEDNSLVEVYKASVNNNTDKTFYEFQKKFPIINYGTEDAYHGGNIQDQSDVQPALVEIGEGTVYVRNRELPLNNVFPGTQVLIAVIEDPSYSDFYESRFNDNGRVNAEDNGQGEVHFGSRMWFSNNSVEDTAINGLNMFQNLNREDYNDQYGNIQLTKFDTNRIFTFKELRTAFVPVDYVITQDSNGTALTVGTSKFLNPIQYFAWEGGIGNNPESFASNGNQMYYVSANSGVIIRFGGNGEEPISKTYLLDNEVRELLRLAVKNGAKIFGGFDRKNDVYVPAIEGYEDGIYNDGLTGWRVTEPLTGTITYEIVTSPAHGDVDFTSPTQWTYTPDTDYAGADSFSYRAIDDGVPTQPENVCLTINEPAIRNTAWRVKPDSYSCVMDGLNQTGYVQYTTLEQFYTDDLSVTGITKPNEPSDADYVSPIFNDTLCPITAPVGNELRQQTFQRNNCGAGQSGSYYNYVVPPNTYFASTLAAANAAADADIAANGQNEANDPANGTTCLLNSVIGFLVIDVEVDTACNVCLYIDTPGVAESLNIVAVAQNFYETTDIPANAYMLASDNMPGPTTVRRFEANIAKLINQYPNDVAVPQFIWKLRGRTTTVGTLSGVYAQKYPNQKMTMTGSPGSYVPSVTPAGGPATVGWSGSITNGADGSVGVAVGNVIKTFTYHRTGGLANTITVS